MSHCSEKQGRQLGRGTGVGGCRGADVETHIGSRAGKGVRGGGTVGQLRSMRPGEGGAPEQGDPVRVLRCLSGHIQVPGMGQELVKLDLTLK